MSPTPNENLESGMARSIRVLAIGVTIGAALCAIGLLGYLGLHAMLAQTDETLTATPSVSSPVVDAPSPIRASGNNDSTEHLVKAPAATPAESQIVSLAPKDAAIDQSLKEAESSFERGDYERAIAVAEQVLAANPESNEARLLLGNTYFALWSTSDNRSNYEKCIDNFKAVLDRDANNGPAHLGRGRAYARADEHEKALQELTDACRLMANSAEPWLLRAGVCFQIGRHAEAFDCYGLSIALKPNYAEAYLGRGWALYCSKQLDKAIEDFTTAATLNPNDAETYHRRALAYLAESQYSAAIEDYSRAISRQPENAELYFGRAIVYSNEKQLDRAIQDLDQCLRFRPNDAGAYIIRARLLGGANQFEKALADYDRAIKLDPNDSMSYFMRGQAYLDQAKQPVQAIDDLEHAISLQPDLAAAYFKLSAAYSANKQNALAALNMGRGNYYSKKYFQAAHDLDRALELQPDLSAAHYELGRAEFLQATLEKKDSPAQKKLIDQAIGSFKKAIKLNPNDADAHFECGKTFAYTYRNGLAYREFDAAIQLRPKFTEAYILRAVTQFGARAIQDIESAIQLDPKSALAYYMRGKFNLSNNQSGAAVEDFSRAIALSTTSSTYTGIPIDNAYDAMLPVSMKAATYSYRSQGLREMRQFDVALNDLDQAMAILPNRASLFHLRARVFEVAGKNAEALADYRRAALLDPTLYKPPVDSDSSKFTNGEKTAMIAGTVVAGAVILQKLVGGSDTTPRSRIRPPNSFTCPRCFGTGRYSPSDMTWLEMGEGGVICPDCYGRGWFRNDGAFHLFMDY